ncbi:MAG TPA: hypothetical protein VGD65_08270 [Chryseosolibacter sp.]
MKKVFYRAASLIALVWLLAWTSACDDDDKPANPQEQIKKTWRIGAAGFVKKDGANVTSEYINLVITLNNDGTYQTSNAKKLFFPSGSWSWVGTDTNQITIDGDLPVTIIELTKSTLRIEFVMDEDHVNAAGRAKAVLGTYQLSLEAQ